MRIFLATTTLFLLLGCGAMPPSSDAPGIGASPTPGDEPLQQGLYKVVDVRPEVNECGLHFELLEDADVTVSTVGELVDIGGFEVTEHDGYLSGQESEEWDWRDRIPAYNCVEMDEEIYSGVVMEATRFTFTIETSWTPVEGDFDECRAANGGLKMPCTSTVTMILNGKNL
jgi:hypothetical protein